MKTINFETLLFMAIISIFGAIGMVAFFLGIMGDRMANIDGGTLLGMVVGLTGIFFSIFCIERIHSDEKGKEKKNVRKIL